MADQGGGQVHQALGQAALLHQLTGEHEAGKNRRHREQNRVRQPPDDAGGPCKERLIELRADARAGFEKVLDARAQPRPEPVRQLSGEREQALFQPRKERGQILRQPGQLPGQIRRFRAQQAAQEKQSAE